MGGDNHARGYADAIDECILGQTLIKAPRLGVSMSEQRKSPVGIYRRQNGPLPTDEIHEFEDDWFDSGLPSSTPPAQRILQYLKCRRAVVEQMARNLSNADYRGPTSDARKLAQRACAQNFQWDAETALKQMDTIAAMFVTEGDRSVPIDLQKTFIEAVKLGKTLERLYVRRLEFWAMLGHRNRGGRDSVLEPHEWVLVCDAVDKRTEELDSIAIRKVNSRRARSDIMVTLAIGEFPGIEREVELEDELLRQRCRKCREQAD
ncbi:hypothetical protein [Lacipirellula sp.]|uniref:hypothetical protein n=1 Tax=Lacipirellula sp. TaxID=2691419 RepID=UPI003D12FE07